MSLRVVVPLFFSLASLAGCGEGLVSGGIAGDGDGGITGDGDGAVSGDGDGAVSGDGDGAVPLDDGGMPLGPDARPLPDAGPPEGVRAFPGAQGFGALATGGRGGRVVKVTTLAASGAGSLQAAFNLNEPRIIVFAVSGVIEGDLDVPYGNLTVAGQTAPGAGITIEGRLTGAYTFGVDNMIFRHIRVRPLYDGSAGIQFDGMQFSRNRRLIFDHMSVSFGIDETFDLYESRDVTVQWTTIESSATQGHPEGEHNYGLINGPDGMRASIHHNLFAHHKNRSPAIANGPAEIRNNVMYNVRHGFIHHNPASGSFNIVGNYFKKGGDDILLPFYFDDESGFAADDLSYYLADNFINDTTSSCNGLVQNPWAECEYDLFAPASKRSPVEATLSGSYWTPVSMQVPTEAYASVLARAGAFPRDIVTRNSVADTTNGVGSWGAYALANPLVGLTVASPPADSDNDGIADAWESSHSLNPNSADDNQTIMPSGYPAIEEYINELANNLVP